MTEATQSSVPEHAIPRAYLVTLTRTARTPNERDGAEEEQTSQRKITVVTDSIPRALAVVVKRIERKPQKGWNPYWHVTPPPSRWEVTAAGSDEVLASGASWPPAEAEQIAQEGGASDDEERAARE